MKDHPAPLLSELAYERILEALFASRLPMGARLTQGELAEVTQVPVGPLRDALRILETDGVLKIHPRSGIEVIRPTTDLVRSTFQFRTMIERPAAQSFARTAPEAEVRRLVARHEEAAAHFATLEPNANVTDRLSALEDEFHPALVAALDNELVDAAYRRLRLMAQVIKVKQVVYPRAALTSVREHLEVLEAGLARDPAAAEDAISRHLANALARNLGMA
jgi:DNA-binding GntR family transcriptional regulator